MTFSDYIGSKKWIPNKLLIRSSSISAEILLLFLIGIDFGTVYSTNLWVSSISGGALKNLRTSPSHQKVKDYHKKFYRADNAAIIVIGQIEPDEIISVLEKFEEKMLSKVKYFILIP